MEIICQNSHAAINFMDVIYAIMKMRTICIDLVIKFLAFFVKQFMLEDHAQNVGQINYFKGKLLIFEFMLLFYL